jgi:hypothetical protein
MAQKPCKYSDFYTLAHVFFYTYSKLSATTMAYDQISGFKTMIFIDFKGIWSRTYKILQQICRLSTYSSIFYKKKEDGF